MRKGLGVRGRGAKVEETSAESEDEKASGAQALEEKAQSERSRKRIKSVGVRGG